MNKIDDNLLDVILPNDIKEADAYNIRKDGKGIKRKVSPYINIESKEDNKGIDIYVKEGTIGGVCDIPVILTESGLNDVVYNDFHIGADSDSVIIAGCGINNPSHLTSRHDGIHRFYIEENAKVKYIEKHYGEGVGDGKRVLNPVTEIYLGKMLIWLWKLVKLKVLMMLLELLRQY